MKKKFLMGGILCVVSIIIISCLLIVGCSKENNSGNTSTGTNPNNSSSGTNNSKELEKNITYKTAIGENDKLIIVIENKNNVSVELNVEAEFYDENGLIVGNDKDRISPVGANSTIAHEFWVTPSAFDNYKVYVDATKTNLKSYVSDLEILQHNIVDNEILVQIKNNSSDIIDIISISVVFYLEDKIVGISSDTEYDIKPERTANFTSRIPYNRNFDNIDYDKYTVFINEAHSY